METRKIKDKRRKKSWFIIIGSLIIVLGFSLLSFDFIKPYVDENTEEKSLEQFYIKEEQIIDKNDKTTSDEVEKEI